MAYYYDKILSKIFLTLTAFYLFSSLGFAQSMPQSARYVGIKLEDLENEISPRQLLGSVPFTHITEALIGSQAQCLVPQGGIIMWLWSGVIDNIPSGWALCDGTNGTPDLRERFAFVMHVTPVANPVRWHSHSRSRSVSGNHTHFHSIFGSQSRSLTSSYYALAFIMKL